MSNVAQVNKSDRNRQTMLTRIGLILAWIVFIIVVCRVSPVTNDNEEFDPFMILSIDEKASISEVKRAYDELSKQYHPDRGGDPEKFKEISKAYKTFTNEEAKENWEQYGNPDGQKELRLGFAIPQWLFDPENSMFILCGYTSFLSLFLSSVVYVEGEDDNVQYPIVKMFYTDNRKICKLDPSWTRKCS